MGGKERLGPQLFAVGNIFDHRPCNAHAIVSGGSPPDLIENEQALFGGFLQDIRHLAHFHHEGRLTCGEIIRRTYSCENLVDHRYFCIVCRHKTAYLRHKCDKSNLTHIS